MTQTSPTCDEALVELFAVLERSLLQYLDEANPWTDAAHADAKATLDRLAAGQRQSAAELADLLAERHLLPGASTFPSEFARWHYLALTFVMDRLLANQIGVVAAADGAVLACGQDPAAKLVQQVRVREAEHLDELRWLLKSLRGDTLI